MPSVGSAAAFKEAADQELAQLMAVSAQLRSLVLTPSEHEALMAAGSRFAVELERDARWLSPWLR